METKPNSFIVGIFVLGLSALGVFLLLWFSKIELNKSENLYHIYFEGAVTGLRANEGVLYQGIRVGKIKKIVIDQNNVQRVKVLVSVETPSVIREDSIASVEVQGLTGAAFIQIEGSTEKSPILSAKAGQKYPVIFSKPSDLEALFTRVPKALDEISQASKQLRKFFNDDVISNATGTVENLHKVMDDLATGSSSLKLLVTDFRTTMTDFSKVAVTINSFVNENRVAVSDFANSGLPAFTQLVKRLRQSAKNFDRVASELERSPAAFLSKNSNQGYQVDSTSNGDIGVGDDGQ